LRVTGGELRGRKLICPRGLATRPCTDMIRQAIFNILAGEVAGSRVLDLFAGTGAIGIEALSRGADFCSFVESSSNAVRVLEKNLGVLDLLRRSAVIRRDVLKALGSLGSQSEGFHLVFIDPPYDKGLCQMTLELVALSGVADPDGVVVVRRHKRESLDAEAAGWVKYKSRKFGEALVEFHRRRR